ALSERVHACVNCGLVADRDLVSAALGSFVVFSDPSDPASARVGYELSRRTLSIERLAQSLSIPGLKVALSESTEVLSAIYQPEHGCIEPEMSGDISTLPVLQGSS
ncbi:MAG: hypothetical protein ACYCTL_12280, partial [Acidimicrobiales bacterium]